MFETWSFLQQDPPVQHAEGGLVVKDESIDNICGDDFISWSGKLFVTLLYPRLLFVILNHKKMARHIRNATVLIVPQMANSVKHNYNQIIKIILEKVVMHTKYFMLDDMIKNKDTIIKALFSTWLSKLGAYYNGKLSFSLYIVC